MHASSVRPSRSKTEYPQWESVASREKREPSTTQGAQALEVRATAEMNVYVSTTHATSLQGDASNISHCTILEMRAAGLGPELGGVTSMPTVLTVLYCLSSYTIERLVER